MISPLQSAGEQQRTHKGEYAANHFLNLITSVTDSDHGKILGFGGWPSAIPLGETNCL